MAAISINCNLSHSASMFSLYVSSPGQSNSMGLYAARVRSSFLVAFVLFRLEEPVWLEIELEAVKVAKQCKWDNH